MLCKTINFKCHIATEHFQVIFYHCFWFWFCFYNTSCLFNNFNSKFIFFLHFYFVMNAIHFYFIYICAPHVWTRHAVLLHACCYCSPFNCHSAKFQIEIELSFICSCLIHHAHEHTLTLIHTQTSIGQHTLSHTQKNTVQWICEFFFLHYKRQNIN